MRLIRRAVVHCSATRPSMDWGLAEIDDLHKSYGWRSPSGIHCGYHYVIRRSGKLELGRPEHEQGAHAGRKYNHDSLGICLIGGVDDKLRPQDNFTDEQEETLRSLLRSIVEEHGDIDICGHRDLPNVAKACPCFDVRPWWAGEKRAEPADLPKDEPWIPEPVIPDWM